MDLREVGYDDREGINLAQHRDQWRAYRYEHEWHMVCHATLQECSEDADCSDSYTKLAREREICPCRDDVCTPPADSSKLNEGDNAGEMSPGSSTEGYPAFARIGLRENPGKNLNQVTCTDRNSNPGHLVSRPDALTVTPQVWTRDSILCGGLNFVVAQWSEHLVYLSVRDRAYLLGFRTKPIRGKCEIPHSVFPT
ncbi:hypothetical protein ANN_16257 [Periplaneta americana]|uniref:Uncharacterized protein n=1 Tax=Periplaneta americana TaxID=6978 RepID=A0ABQ8SIS0_PERAM|nr:hypothetical protein ANN_16257 [Periplaneta americana]